MIEVLKLAHRLPGCKKVAILAVLENQMEKKMENEMESQGPFKGVYRDYRDIGYLRCFELRERKSQGESSN